MATVVLARLFRDIDRVPEAERSPYERAVHRELEMLGLGGSASGEARAASSPDSVPSLDWSDIDPDQVRSGVRDLQTQMKTDVDFGPGAKPHDVRRLSCTYPKCRAKRQ